MTPTWERRGLDEVRTEAPVAAAVLTPARRELQDTARAFAMEEVLPVADELDPRREDIPPDLLARMAELGYFGLLVDPEHGGQGAGRFGESGVLRGGPRPPRGRRSATSACWSTPSTAGRAWACSSTAWSPRSSPAPG